MAKILYLYHPGSFSQEDSDTADKKTAAIREAIARLTERNDLSFLLERRREWAFMFEMRDENCNPYYRIIVASGTLRIDSAVMETLERRRAAIEDRNSYTTSNDHGWGAIRLAYDDETITSSEVYSYVGDIAMCFVGAIEHFDLLFVAEFFSELKKIFRECYPTTSGEYPRLAEMMETEPMLRYYFCDR